MSCQHSADVRCLWCVSEAEWTHIKAQHPALLDKLAVRIDWEPASALVFTLDGQEATP